MPNNDEINNAKAVVLKKIDDPFVKDAVHIGSVFAGFSTRLMTASAVVSTCYATCGAILEAGDHTLGLLCYTGCVAFSGGIFFVGANSLVEYANFRKRWQDVSIPIKNWILSFF